jgi:hypothetical protein
MVIGCIKAPLFSRGPCATFSTTLLPNCLQQIIPLATSSKITNSGWSVSYSNNRNRRSIFITKHPSPHIEPSTYLRHRNGIHDHQHPLPRTVAMPDVKLEPRCTNQIEPRVFCA